MNQDYSIANTNIDILLKHFWIIIFSFFVCLGIIQQDIPRYDMSIHLGEKILWILNGILVMQLIFNDQNCIIKKKIDTNQKHFFCQLLMFYIGVVIVGIFKNQSFRPQIMLVICSPLIFSFLLCYNITQKQLTSLIKTTFFAYVFSYLILLILRGNLTTFDLKTYIDGFISSDVPTESDYGLVFIFFILFFIHLKKKKNFIFAILMAVLSFKRVAIIALVVGFIFGKISVKHDILIKRTAALLTLALSIFYILIVPLFINGTFDYVITKYTNQSVDKLSMGRQALYTTIDNEVNFSKINWWGKGWTFVTLLVEKYPNLFPNGLKHLHSDLLKNYIEFGLVIYFLWVILLIKVCMPSRQALANLLMLFVLMATDNAFSYSFVLIPFYLTTYYYLREASTLIHIISTKSISLEII